MNELDRKMLYGMFILMMRGLLMLIPGANPDKQKLQYEYEDLLEHLRKWVAG